MIIGMPVVDGHEITEAALQAMAKTVATPTGLVVVIIDNGSEEPYIDSDYSEYPFNVLVNRYDQNKGYYTPLGDLYLQNLEGAFGPVHETVGLMHNDLMLYTPGWDEIMAGAFKNDPKLGLVGLCGSNEIDDRGGRGNGTMCNFVGAEVLVGATKFQGQSPSAGLHIFNLKPACVLDSLFMLFRASAVPSLVAHGELWNDLTLAHFYDRIWPCRVIEAGYRVAIAPVDCDHIGGLTTTGNERYRDDCITWLEERNIPYENPETEMYLVAERRFLGEYREEKHFLPCYVNENYELEHRYGRA